MAECKRQIEYKDIMKPVAYRLRERRERAELLESWLTSGAIYTQHGFGVPFYLAVFHVGALKFNDVGHPDDFPGEKLVADIALALAAGQGETLDERMKRMNRLRGERSSRHMAELKRVGNTPLTWKLEK